MPRIVLLYKEQGYVAGDAAIFAPGSDETLSPVDAARLLHEYKGDKANFVGVPISTGDENRPILNWDTTYFVHIAGDDIPALQGDKSLAESGMGSSLRLVASVKRTTAS